MVVPKGDVVTKIFEWFRAARPKPTTRSFKTQLGVHCEEINEMLIELVAEGQTAILLDAAAKAMHSLAENLKSEEVDFIYVPRQNYKGYLDALCDQVVTATGCAWDAQFNFPPALNEVNRSNYSKFENGRPIFLPTGKISKGKDYSPADLSPFLELPTV